MRKSCTLRRCFGVVSLFVMVASCGGDDGQGPSDAAPQITGCNRVRYQDLTWTTGCQPGITSFTQESCIEGTCACFDLTCSQGCVSTVVVCQAALVAAVRLPTRRFANRADQKDGSLDYLDQALRSARGCQS